MAEKFFIHLPDPQNRIEAWGKVLFRDESGEIYIPAFLAADEFRVLLEMSYDGTPAIFDEGHLYAPGTWLSENYPELRDIVEVRKQDLLRQFPEYAA